MFNKFSIKTVYLGVCIIVLFLVHSYSLMGRKFTKDESQNANSIPNQIYGLAKDNNGYFTLINKHFNGERWVHFDLKGAPPKAEYLIECFKFISKLGATGILMEYEDMFPYKDDIASIAAPNAYTLQNITAMLETANMLKLKLVPLIQTFGHLEFALKGKAFKHLRETEDMPDVICPNQKESINFIYKMIDQVMDAHPDAQYIHIGGDEVYTLGACDRCKSVIKKYKIRRKNIYFRHVLRIAKYIHNMHPTSRPIMWGDEYVKKNEEIILNYDIPKFVDIMVWNYGYKIEDYPPKSEMAFYAETLSNMWIASAFKGALSQGQILPDVSYYLNNQMIWMNIVTNWKNKIQFTGIVLTGWQRFNHLSILCELLPSAMPSLATALLFLGETDVDARHTLKCNFPVLNFHPGTTYSNLRCSFPGANIYIAILNFVQKLDEIETGTAFLKNPFFAFYGTMFNYTQPRLYKNHLRTLKVYLSDLNQQEHVLRQELSQAYDEYTISEWIITNVLPHQMRLESAIHILTSLKKIRVWPSRPDPSSEIRIREYYRSFCNANNVTLCSFFHMFHK